MVGRWDGVLCLFPFHSPVFEVIPPSKMFLFFFPPGWIGMSVSFLLTSLLSGLIVTGKQAEDNIHHRTIHQTDRLRQTNHIPERTDKKETEQDESSDQKRSKEDKTAPQKQESNSAATTPRT